MDTVANMSADERAELFRETGEKMGLSGALVEKDFWVCWVLGHLFEMPRVRDMLMFKGGTSLSNQPQRTGGRLTTGGDLVPPCPSPTPT